jgi:hypothetical protein
VAIDVGEPQQRAENPVSIPAGIARHLPEPLELKRVEIRPFRSRNMQADPGNYIIPFRYYSLNVLSCSVQNALFNDQDSAEPEHMRTEVAARPPVGGRK